MYQPETEYYLGQNEQNGYAIVEHINHRFPHEGRCVFSVCEYGISDDSGAPISYDDTFVEIEEDVRKQAMKCSVTWKGNWYLSETRAPHPLKGMSKQVTIFSPVENSTTSSAYIKVMSCSKVSIVTSMTLILTPTHSLWTTSGPL